MWSTARSKTLLALSDLTLADRSVEGVDMIARAGEITGIAGLVGCGKSELIRAVFGLEDVAHGAVTLGGEAYTHPTPARSLERGVCYFPSDRMVEGLALTRPIRENVSMAALDLDVVSKRRMLQPIAERRLVQTIVDRLGLRPPNIERMVGNLSGGNRQKVMLARGLTRETRVFLFDEPTVGIDVGAKVEVYDLMKQLVDAGAAVVLVSSELSEVLHLSNRLYVMHRGRIVAELSGADIEEQTVLEFFFRDNKEETAA